MQPVLSHWSWQIKKCYSVNLFSNTLYVANVWWMCSCLNDPPSILWICCSYCMSVIETSRKVSLAICSSQRLGWKYKHQNRFVDDECSKKSCTFISRQASLKHAPHSIYIWRGMKKCPLETSCSVLGHHIRANHWHQLSNYVPNLLHP